MNVTMLEWFARGGFLMYPLLFGSILMVAVVLERGFHFIASGVNRRVVESVVRSLGLGDVSGALETVGGSRDPVSTVIREILDLRKSPAEVIENEVSIMGEQILKGLGKNMHLLELIGKISPMIGLLGTVLGMVEAFQRVSEVRAVVDPSILARGIWEALLTTVAGLFVGIPALVAHHLYENKLKSIAFSMKHYGQEVISLLRGTG